jgi:hypothetical protein
MEVRSKLTAVGDLFPCLDVSKGDDLHGHVAGTISPEDTFSRQSTLSSATTPDFLWQH